MGRAGGNVREAEACCTAFQENARNVVVFVILKHTALNDGSRRDHADDVALDEALGLCRVFHLLTDGDLIALRDEAGHIALIAVERYAAHGRALFEAALLAREGQIQLPRDCERIVEEHLVEVTDAVEKNLILMLFFDFQILLHHGRKLCHDCSPSSPSCRFAIQNRLLQAKRGPALHSRVLCFMV